jgi:hypothetical protein
MMISNDERCNISNPIINMQQFVKQLILEEYYDFEFRTGREAILELMDLKTTITDKPNNTICVTRSDGCHYVCSHTRGIWFVDGNSIRFYLVLRDMHMFINSINDVRLYDYTVMRGFIVSAVHNLFMTHTKMTDKYYNDVIQSYFKCQTRSLFFTPAILSPNVEINDMTILKYTKAYVIKIAIFNQTDLCDDVHGLVVRWFVAVCSYLL